MTANRASSLLLAGLMVVVVAGCGGSDDGGATAGEQKIEGAKVIDVASMENPSKGTLSYCTGKDTSGALGRAVDQFNAEYEAQGLEAELFEFPEEADEQRNQFIQRAQAKSPECDIFYADDVWTAEFASQKWIYDLTPYVQERASEFVPATLETVKYADKRWGVPKQTNAGFLYYRTDQVASAPATWQDVYAEAEAKGGIAYQGAAYEGLTVNYLEVAFAAGGKILSPDGKKSMINSPENLEALQLMVDGVKSGAALKGVATYEEEPTRRAFEAGRATFMRNWPYAYPLAKMSKVSDDFAVAPLPSFEGGGKGQVVGARNLVISAYTKNPGGSLALIDFLTSPEIERQDAIKYSLAPVLTKTYDEPAVKRAMPYSEQLLQAVQQGTARPVSPVYSQISQAIYKQVNEALSGTTTPEEALEQADEEINTALKTF